jgi:exodeoxyribonuclease VII large subunit
MRRRLDGGGGQLGELAGRLSALSPLRVLERGYALATTEGRVVKDAAKVCAGDRVDVRLARGTVHCVAESTTIEPGEEASE